MPGLLDPVQQAAALTEAERHLELALRYMDEAGANVPAARAQHALDNLRSLMGVSAPQGDRRNLA
jgi:hypothetical protein